MACIEFVYNISRGAERVIFLYFGRVTLHSWVKVVHGSASETERERGEECV